jgi:hypothetical protein
MPDDTTIVPPSAWMWNAPLGGGAWKLGLVMGDFKGILGASRRTLTWRPVFKENTSTVVW